MTTTRPYIGRFAPSPTGPLHAGSLVAALASWLDARAHRGQWLVRLEDIDPPRCQPGADRLILQQLAHCGLHPDAPPVWQSHRAPHYEAALRQLMARRACYPCSCTRKAIETALQAQGHIRTRHHTPVYPGTCRPHANTPPLATDLDRPRTAWRLRTDPFEPNMPEASVGRRFSAINFEANQLKWHDRRLGPQQQDVPSEVGDFVLKRADGLWAYQLAVVVDDHLQGVTDVVRGEDLVDNTARQILLQQWLEAPRPRYLHTPLVRDASGEKLSKQHGAPALEVSTPEQALVALKQAARTLNLPESQSTDIPAALEAWTHAWAQSAASRHP